MRAPAHPVRVVIADDHNLFRAGLAALLSSDARVEVVGQARDGQEALDQVMEQKPNVVLMDLMMPKVGGLEATRILVRDAPDVKVLVLSAYADNATVGEVQASGAQGLIYKDSALGEMLNAILTVAPGNDRWRTTARSDLSHREMIMLREVAAGRSNKQIARRLGISEKTVRNHLSRAYGKLGVTNRTEAVIHALRSGVVIA